MIYLKNASYTSEEVQLKFEYILKTYFFATLYFGFGSGFGNSSLLIAPTFDRFAMTKAADSIVPVCIAVLEPC